MQFTYACMARSYLRRLGRYFSEASHLQNCNLAYSAGLLLTASATLHSGSTGTICMFTVKGAIIGWVGDSKA
eukprot:923376-Prorocentrum_minimum.AAC.1